MKALLFAAFLVVWGNLLHPLIGSTAVLPGGSLAFVLAGALLAAASFGAARLLRVDPAGLGLRRAGAVRGAAIGAAGAAAIGAAAVLAVRLAPLVIGAPIDYRPLANVSSAELATHIALLLPLGTVVPEELAFRGTLLGALVARHTVWSAVAISAGAFALWHGTVAVFTVMNTTVPVVLIVPAILGALLVVFVGGVVLAALRLWTGSLATTVAAHWVFNTAVLVGLRP